MNNLFKFFFTMTAMSFFLMVSPAHSKSHVGEYAGVNNLTLKGYNDNFKFDNTTAMNHINHIKQYANRVISNIGRVNDPKIILITYGNLLQAELNLTTLVASNDPDVARAAQKALTVVRNAKIAVQNRALALIPPVDLKKAKKPKLSPYIQDMKEEKS